MKNKLRRISAMILSLLMTISMVGGDVLTVVALDETYQETESVTETEPATAAETESQTESETPAPTEAVTEATTEAAPETEETVQTTEETTESAVETQAETAPSTEQETEAPSYTVNFKIHENGTAKVYVNGQEVTYKVTDEGKVTFIVEANDQFEVNVADTISANPDLNIHRTSRTDVNEFEVSEVKSDITINIHTQKIPETESEEPPSEETQASETETTETSEETEETESETIEESVVETESETETVEETTEDETTGEELLPPLFSNGISLFSISGEKTVKVGKEITLTSDKGTSSNYEHQWSVDSPNRAAISANGSEATLTGLEAGEVTVTHQWRRGSWWDWNSETYQVTVVDEEPETPEADIRRIYVYVKLDAADGVDTSGWTVNGQGWYTIGYVDAVVPSPDNYDNGDYLDGEYKANVLNALSGINYYSVNQAVSQGIDLSNIDWNAAGYRVHKHI